LGFYLDDSVGFVSHILYNAGFVHVTPIIARQNMEVLTAPPPDARLKNELRPIVSIRDSLVDGTNSFEPFWYMRFRSSLV
jgi:hypothetical protein